MKQDSSRKTAAWSGSEEGRLRHLRRLAFLSALFFISGLLFFFMQTILQKSNDPAQNSGQVQVVEGLVPVQPVDLSKFQTFTYKPGLGKVLVEGTCADKFYAIIIYSQNVDYRQSAQDAKYNVATPCPPSKHFKAVVPLYSPPFENGQKYYLIRANQGTKGAWYNPY